MSACLHSTASTHSHIPISKLRTTGKRASSEVPMTAEGSSTLQAPPLAASTSQEKRTSSPTHHIQFAASLFHFQGSSFPPLQAEIRSLSDFSAFVSLVRSGPARGSVSVSSRLGKLREIPESDPTITETRSLSLNHVVSRNLGFS